MLRRPSALCCHQRQDHETLRQWQIRTIYQSIIRTTYSQLEIVIFFQNYVNKVDDCLSNVKSNNGTGGPVGPYQLLF